MDYTVVLQQRLTWKIPIIFFLAMAGLLTSCEARQAMELSAPVQGPESVPEHSPDVFLVTFDEKVGKAPLLKAIEAYKCEIKYDYNFINGMALKKPEDKTLEETMQYFRTVEGVTAVEYDHIIRLTDPVKPKLEIE